MELIYKTALAYTFFSQVAQTVTVDALLIARGLVRPSLNPVVLQALMPHPGIGLLADLAIGAALGAVLYALRGRVLERPRGWLVGFGALALVSLVITVGPSVGMRLGIGLALRTLAVSLVRDLLTVLVAVYWARPPRKRWLDWAVVGLIGLALAAFVLWAVEAVMMVSLFGPR